MARSKYVFISYSSKDGGEAALITKLLDDAGVDWWKAPEKIPAGSGYAQEIGRAIEECELFLLVLSQNSLKSVWVEKELECAVSAHRNLVAFNLDKTELSDSFKFYLKSDQIILNTGGPKSGPAELIQRAKEAVGIASAAGEGVTSGAVQKKMIYSNPFSVNRIPACCMYCGGKVSFKSEGVYVCRDCQKENYDDFKTIKDYIRANGPCTVTKLTQELKIPRNIINSWWEEENRN